MPPVLNILKQRKQEVLPRALSDFLYSKLKSTRNNVNSLLLLFS